MSVLCPVQRPCTPFQSIISQTPPADWTFCVLWTVVLTFHHQPTHFTRMTLLDIVVIIHIVSYHICRVYFNGENVFLHLYNWICYEGMDFRVPIIADHHHNSKAHGRQTKRLFRVTAVHPPPFVDFFRFS